MKALLILKNHNFNLNRFNELAGVESSKGYEVYIVTGKQIGRAHV